MVEWSSGMKEKKYTFMRAVLKILHSISGYEILKSSSNFKWNLQNINGIKQNFSNLTEMSEIKAEF